MKFGKDFKKQMVPEWKEAYMDYNGLKRVLHQILRFKQNRHPGSCRKTSQQNSTLQGSFTGLALQSTDRQGEQDVEDPVITINTMQEESSREFYRTKFLLQPEGGEDEVIFFGKLDRELNKVNTFYKDKVEEMVNEATSLDKQMGALIALRFKVQNPDFDHSSSMPHHSNDVDSNTDTKVAASLSRVGTSTSGKGLNDQPLEVDIESNGRGGISSVQPITDRTACIEEVQNVNCQPVINLEILDHVKINSNTLETPRSTIEGMEHTDVRLGVEMHKACQLEIIENPENGKGLTDQPLEVDIERNHQGGNSSVQLATVRTACIEEHNVNSQPVVTLEILDHVKINNTLETPRSTIKAVMKDGKEVELSFTKEELKKVEARLKHVFIEFYQKLLLLKNYSFTNLSAFSKIMKKYEKITSRSASKSYMETVDNSYLGSSDEIGALLERVEVAFVKHFSKSNRREGMKSLRPKTKREKHRIAFFSGFFSGCSIALLVAIILIIGARNIMNTQGSLYIENIFPLYSLFAYIVLHMLMYAANIYFWKHYGVNYPFIFGFKRGTELGYREIFLLSTGLAVLALASFLANLHVDIDSQSKVYQASTEMIPLGLVALVVVITLCPFNIIYRSSRFFLVQCIFRCICAPLYQVTLPDFFLADQLTSQVQAIRSIEFYICFYGSGNFHRRPNKCRSLDAYNVFYFIVAVVPYWIRCLQCLRRLYEDRDAKHGYNGLKYFLTVVAVVIRSAFDLKKAMIWKVLAIVSSVIATIMSTYWDIIMDWGLLQRKSKNFCLRDKLLVSHKSVYFLAMALNILLRFAWLQLVLKFKVHSLDGTPLVIIIACLEILRRGIWNFFRLENEHLNNVGKYRAFKSVPLPFNYCDEDTDKDD